MNVLYPKNTLYFLMPVRPFSGEEKNINVFPPVGGQVFFSPEVLEGGAVTFF
jgi:hypothetical protein